MKVLQGECPSIHARVVEAGSPPLDGWVSVEIGKTIVFKMKSLDDYRTKNWDSRIYDAMVVIAAVEFCDKSCRRSAWGWMRQIKLDLPVHDLEHWAKPGISASLVSALKFLTGDEWEVSFHRRRGPPEEIGSGQSRLDLSDPNRVVTPFSDGLDSRAVTALQSVGGRGDRLIRVRVGSKKDDRPLHESQEVPFLNIPFVVRSGQEGFAESSVRSRGFKFTFLSAIAAYLLGTHKVIMPESGQGALGPALVPTSHGYEDYRNHPRFLGKMEQFFSSLFDYQIVYELPQLWKTKGQSLRAFADLPISPSEWTDTKSCWQQNRNSSVDGKWRHCGICAACMLRRLSFHAADVDEPKDNYIWEDLSVGDFSDGVAKGFDKVTGAMQQYAIAGVLHLDHLANLRSSRVNRARISRHAWQLSEELDVAPEETEAMLGELLDRHEMEWKAFMKHLGPKSFVAQWLA